MRSIFVVVGVVFTFCIGPALGAPDVVYDLTGPGSVVGPGAGGEIWESYDPDKSTGTGIFTPFLRIQNNGVEKGFNTDGTPQWDTKNPPWTHSLMLTDVPYLEVGGVGYREFLMDADQEGGDDRYLSIDELVIRLEATDNLTAYDSAFSGPVVFDLDSGGVDRSVLVNASLFASGSGTGDLRVLIPDASFVGTNPYVYLYALMGENVVANDGFEEWAIRVGGTPPPPPVVPVPGAILLGALGIGGVGLLRQRKLLGR
jgi:hypothetical protein